MENPTPELTAFPVVWSTLFVRIDWLTPTTSPFKLKSGPPELPGLMAASVWIISAVLKAPPPSGATCAGCVLPSPEIMPRVMVPFNPKGLPMATTDCPTKREFESPIGKGWIWSAGASTLITAISASASVPITVPCALKPEAKSTSTTLAPSTTWLLVTTWPSLSNTKPDPRPVSVRMATTPGSTAW